MARPSGVRNPDYDEKRQVLLDKVTSYILQNETDRPSLRQLSIAAEASEPTLRHYFGDRTGLVIAIMEQLNQMADPMRAAFRGPFDTIGDAVNTYAKRAHSMSLDKGYTYGSLFMMKECLADAAIFQKYVTEIMEPAIAALAEGFLTAKGGPKTFAHARIAAMMIVTNAMSLTFRKHIMGDGDPSPFDFDSKFSLMANWMLKGLEHDPVELADAVQADETS